MEPTADSSHGQGTVPEKQEKRRLYFVVHDPTGGDSYDIPDYGPIPDLGPTGSGTTQELFIAFAERIVSRISESLAVEGEPYHSVVKQTYDAYALPTLQAVERVNYGKYLGRLFDDPVLETPDVENCIKRFLTEELLQFPRLVDQNHEAVTDFEEIRHQPYRRLLGLLVDLFYECDTFNPNQEQIIQLFDNIKAEASQDSFNTSITIPLLDFKYRGENININDQLKLIPLDQDARIQLWGQNPYHSTITYSDFNRSTSGLIGQYYQKKKSFHSTRDITVRHAERFVTALRLLKAGNVNAPAAFESLQTRLRYQHEGAAINPIDELAAKSEFGPYGSGFRTITFPRPNYELQIDEVSKVFEIYKCLEANSAGELEIAIRRFNQSYNRRTAEDAIIDLTIALESCLLHNADDELKYRLSLRGATLLARIRDPEETKQILQLMYDVRSAIVHAGASIESIHKSKSTKSKELLKRISRITSPTSTYALPLKLEDIVRDILRSYLFRISSGKSLSEVNEDLDAAIVRGLESKPKGDNGWIFRLTP